MVAIPVFRSRVAPVLNWCTKLMVIDSSQPDAPVLEPLDFDPSDPFRRLREIRAKGVTTVICGALSRELLLYAGSLGMEVICGISGELSEVIEGYRKGCLDKACFQLPGCQGGRLYCRYRRRLSGGTQAFGERYNGCARGRSAQSAGSGQCLCPECGASARHEPGIPCSMVACPECGRPMIRG